MRTAGNLKFLKQLSITAKVADLMTKLGNKKLPTSFTKISGGSSGGGGGGGLHPKQIRLKELQREFQKDDGLPVHLKLPSDRMLVNATYALCGIGMLCNLKVYFDLAKLK